MIKNLLTITLLTLIGSILAGCASTPEHMPKVEPGTKKIVTIYKNDDAYTSVPGTDLSQRDQANARIGGKVEKYYNGRYIDPNTGDMYGKGTIYRVIESPHWNLTPNHDVQPYEVDEAYKHITNLVNAAPLYAELDNKVQNATKINRTLENQVEQMRRTNEQLSNQSEKLRQYNEAIATLKKENDKLREQNHKLNNTINSSKRDSSAFKQTKAKQQAAKSEKNQQQEAVSTMSEKTTNINDLNV
jgi:DNA repair exonuclease SbcCD ATPase subunit